MDADSQGNLTEMLGWWQIKRIFPKIEKLLKMGKLGLDMYLFFIRCEKTCDLPVTREKTVAETSFLCGFRDKGESSNYLTHV